MRRYGIFTDNLKPTLSFDRYERDLERSGIARFSHVKLPDQQFKQFIDNVVLLPETKKFKCSFSHVQVSDANIREFCRIIKYQASIDFKFCALSGTALHILSDQLRYNRQITTLHLEGNQICSDDFAYIFNSVNHTQSLRKLFLNHTRNYQASDYHNANISLGRLLNTNRSLEVLTLDDHYETVHNYINLLDTFSNHLNATSTLHTISIKTNLNRLINSDQDKQKLSAAIDKLANTIEKECRLTTVEIGHYRSDQNDDVVENSLKKLHDVLLKNSSVNTRLFDAIKQGDIKHVNLLINKHAFDPAISDVETGFNVFHYAALNHVNPKQMIDFLIENGFAKNLMRRCKSSHDATPPLFLAIKHHNIFAATHFLNNIKKIDAALDEADRYGNCARDVIPTEIISYMQNHCSGI